MLKYLKQFVNHTAYQAAESNLDKPNVSLCVQEDEVHYNPYIPEPDFTAIVYGSANGDDYPVGTKSEVWVELKKDITQNTVLDNGNQQLSVIRDDRTGSINISWDNVGMNEKFYVIIRDANFPLVVGRYKITCNTQKPVDVTGWENEF